MTRKNNTIYFDSDEDFFDFCVVKAPIIRQGKHGKYVDFKFTDMYEKELNNGTRFCIKDENSLIAKRGVVTYMTESKEVKNLDTWYGVEL